MNKTVFGVRVEINDGGWDCPYHLFETVDDAVQNLRNRVASHLMYARRNGMKIHHYNVWRDSPTDYVGDELSQTINFWVNDTLFEYRVFGFRLMAHNNESNRHI